LFVLLCSRHTRPRFATICYPIKRRAVKCETEAVLFAPPIVLWFEIIAEPRGRPADCNHLSLRGDIADADGKSKKLEIAPSTWRTSLAVGVASMNEPGLSSIMLRRGEANSS
jgi:hypothetical protein